MIHFRIADWFALRFLQAPGCGRMRVMSTETTAGMPTTRRYANQARGLVRLQGQDDLRR